MRGRRWLALGCVSLLAGSLLLGGCGTGGNAEKTSKLSVTATIFPVAEVARAVGGDKVDVHTLVAPGVEPHDWEPSTKDLRQLGSAKVFLYSGLGMEPVSKLLQPDVLKDAKAYALSEAPGITLLPMASDGVTVGPADDDDHDHDHDKGHDHDKDKDHDHDKDKGHDHDKEHEGTYDPHIWLDPMNMIAETKYVVEIFSKLDPANADYYKANGEAYIKKLTALNASYTAWRAKTSANTLVVTHRAFGYLAHRYHLKQVGIMGIAPESEPTPDTMARLASYVKEHQIHAIFSETLVNPKLADTLAAETGAKVYVLNPAEGVTTEQQQQGLTYIKIMEENLKTLETAFGTAQP